MNSQQLTAVVGVLGLGLAAAAFVLSQKKTDDPGGGGDGGILTVIGLPNLRVVRG